MKNELAIFENCPIRSVEHEGEMYFSIIDIIGVLTDSPIPRNYWNLLKKREQQLHTNCMQLKLPSADGKNYKTDCANTEGCLESSCPCPRQRLNL